MNNMYDHHNMPHPGYHHPHRHVGHPGHPLPHHHHHPPPHPHPHHMHPIHHHPGMPSRPPLANKTVHANIQVYDAQPHHWQKPAMFTSVEQSLPPHLVGSQMAAEQPPVTASSAAHTIPISQETATPQISKTQQHNLAKRQVKTPITLCFERMLGAGTFMWNQNEAAWIIPQQRNILTSPFLYSGSD